VSHSRNSSSFFNSDSNNTSEANKAPREVSSSPQRGLSHSRRCSDLFALGEKEGEKESQALTSPNTSSTHQSGPR
jgi:hypothetical protein